MALQRRRRRSARPAPRTTVRRTFRLPGADVGRYDNLDTPSFTLIDLQRASQSTLTRTLGLSATRARALIALRRTESLRPHTLADRRQLLSDLRNLHSRVFYGGEDPVHVVDVVPRGGFIMSRRPFALEVEF